jgi:hypothetical protein
VQNSLDSHTTQLLGRYTFIHSSTPKYFIINDEKSSLEPFCVRKPRDDVSIIALQISPSITSTVKNSEQNCELEYLKTTITLNETRWLHLTLDRVSLIAFPCVKLLYTILWRMALSSARFRVRYIAA